MDGKATISTNSGAVTAHYGKQRKEVKRYFERRRNRELKKNAAMRDDQLFLFADETNKAITNGASDSNSCNSGPIAAVDNSVTLACTTNMLSHNQTQLHEQDQQKKNKQNVQNAHKAKINNVQQEELESALTHKIITITTTTNNTTTGNTGNTKSKAVENSIISSSDNTTSATKAKKTKKKKSKATKVNGSLENKADIMLHEHNAVKRIDNKTSNNNDSNTYNNNDITKSNGIKNNDCVNKLALPTHNKYMIDKQLICYHNHQNNTITNKSNANMLHVESEIQEKPCTTAVNNLHEHEEEWSSACMTVATCPQECERACCNFTKSKSSHNSASPKPTLISILPILEAMHNAHCGKTNKCTSTKTCSASAQCGSTNVKVNNKPTFSYSSSSASARSTSIVSSSPTTMECNPKGKCITPTKSISSSGGDDSNEGIYKSENATSSSLLTSSSSFSSSSESSSSSSNSGLENLLLETPTFTDNNNKNIIITTTTERSDMDSKRDIMEKKHSNSSCSSESSSLLLSRSKSKSSSPVRVMNMDGSANHPTRLHQDKLHKTQEKDEHSEHYYSSNKYNSSSPCIVTSMVRRLDQVPPLPITRPLSSGTSLNVPTRNYLLLDREYNLHQFAPGFKRNDELALESLLETASLEWHKIQKHSCEALLDSSTNVECDMCNRMNNSFVITTANAMKALFQVGYMAHKKLALKVIRIGPDIVIDTCAASCYGDHSSVYDLRRQALIGKALYRLREESSKVFDHEEEEEEEVHYDKEISHQVNVNPSNNNNINGSKETKTTPVNTCRDIIPLSRQASLNFVENNHITDNKMRNTSMNNNGAIRANPLSSALVAHKREYSRFSQVMYWNIDALELLVGVDVPIILDVRTNTEHLLRLMDEADDEENALHSEQLYCDALNCWFDATIANVPEVGVYIHNAGVIQRFELKKVNELLSRVQGKVAAMSMNFTSNVLQWIVSQCVKDKATYIVVRGDESAYLKMYKIPSEETNNTDYCSSSDNTTSSTNNCTTTTTVASTEKNTNNNTMKKQHELQENNVNTEKESMNMKEDNVEELKHPQTKQHYGKQDMTCNRNRQHETALGHDGVRLTSKTEKNEELPCNNKLKTVSTVETQESKCELDKMSGVVCLYNNTKEASVDTPNVQSEILCITNKNEEEERQREEKKKCLDAEEAHKERLSVSLAQMCYAMGVHLHSEADKRKANEAIGLLRRTFLIHVRRIHDSRAKEMVMDVVQRLPSLIGLMLSTMWSENETTTSNNTNVEREDDKNSLVNKIANLHHQHSNDNNKSGNTNKGNSYKKNETKEVSVLRECDMEIKPFDRHVHPWATWTCVEALKLCVQFQEPLLQAIRQTTKCTLSFTFYATCLIECSAALSVLVARTLEAFCAERKCIFAAEFAAAKETRWKRQRNQKQQQQGNCKNIPLQPLQNAIVVNDNKTPVRGEDALRPFLATIVEGLVLLEHVNHTIEELSHSATTATTSNVNNTNEATMQESENNNNNENISTHETSGKEVKEHEQDATLVKKSKEKTNIKSNDKETIESSWTIELAPLRAALCELYGDLILLTMADPTTFTSLILKRIATEMSVQWSGCSWNINSYGTTTNNNADINMANKSNPISSKNTTLQWLRCISSDAVSLSFTALRFYTKSSTTAQRQLLKTGQVHYFVGQFHHRVDRYTKSLEALHRAKSIFALAAKTNKVPPFGECFCSSSLVTVEDVMEALGDVYADLAELKEHVALNMFTGQNKCISSNNNIKSSMCIVYTIYTNSCHTNMINKTLSVNAYVALQPILLGPLHVMCEEEENFLRRAINAYTSSACLSAKAHVLIKYANTQIGNLTLRSTSENAMKLVGIDKTESKHIYYLLQEAKNVNVNVLEWQRQWELMRLLEVTKTGECEDHLLAEVEEIVKEWISVYIKTSSSQHQEMLLSENKVCDNDVNANEMSRSTIIEKVYSSTNRKNTEKEAMESKTIELDHISTIEQMLQLSVTCIRIAEEYKYNLQAKRLSNKYNNVEDARVKLREMQERHQRTRCVHWARQALCVLIKLIDDVLDINNNKIEITEKVIEEEEVENIQTEQHTYNDNTSNKEKETNTKENSTLTSINANTANEDWNVLLSPWMRVWRFAFSTVNINTTTIAEENNNNNVKIITGNDALCDDLQKWCYFVCIIVCRVLQCINDDTLDISGDIKITDNGSLQNNNHSNSSNTSAVKVIVKNTKRSDALAEVVQELLTRDENMTTSKLFELLCTLRTQLKKLS